MKIYLFSLFSVFYFNCFCNITDSTFLNRRYQKGNFSVSSNMLFDLGFTINDTINQQIVGFGLANTFEYAVKKNWFIGVGVSYKRQNYYTIKKLENQNLFDLIICTNYKFRTLKKVPHSLELMYIGGERSNFKNGMSINSSRLPYASKLRFSYGFHFHLNKLEAIDFGLKIHHTMILNKKTYYQDATYFNLYLNYYFIRKKLDNQTYYEYPQKEKNVIPFKKGTYCISNNLILFPRFTTHDTINQQTIRFGLAPTIDYAIKPNWYIGGGLSFERIYFNTIKPLKNQNLFDFTLNTRYLFRTKKDVPHFLELMYIGGERSYFKNNQEINSSKIPYVSKLRIAYGIHYQPNTFKNIALGVKFHRTFHISSKNIYRNYSFLNLYLNYYFKRKK